MDIFGGAPRVLGYSRPVLAPCGTDATLRCQIGGDPRPDVVWERKNVQILSEGRYKLSEDGKAYLLTIASVTSDDAGQYICKAKNSVGETYAAATLKVEEQQPDKQINGNLKQVNGHEKLHNGECGTENGRLANGEEKSNGLTEKTDEEELSSDRPRFLIKPLSLRVDRGEDAAFSCKIWGNPMPEVEWQKDGKKLDDIFENSHFSANSQDGGWFQLKIYRTRMPDKGVYTCKAVNCNGEELAGAVLLVEPVPEREESKRSSSGRTNSQQSPKLRGGRLGILRNKDEPSVNPSKVKKFAVAEGKHAKFRCLVTGKPKPEIVWKKDGVSLEPGRRHLMFEDREGYYTLKVLYGKREDTGLYVCAASNALGNTLSAVHLSVKGPSVRFRRQLKDVEVAENDVAVLECEVPDESLPAAWYLEDQRLMPNQKYGMEQRGTRRRLTIRDVGTDDDGVYLCEMPDGAKSIAELSVKGPIVRKLPRKMEVLEGENAAFCVEVDQDEMEVHWFKDGLRQHESHHTILKSFGKTHILVFVNVAHHDSGVVTFVAGRSTTTSRLRVKATRHLPPVCPVDIRMDDERPNSALLSWSPAAHSQSSTRSVFVVERREVGAQEWHRCFSSETATSADVSGDSVPEEGDYRFRVCCINKYGRSGHVEFPRAVHLVLGPKICTPLRWCEVVEGEEARFTLELSASMVGTWFLNSSQLQHGGRYTVTHSQTSHSLLIQETQAADDGAEVTFIANGVRDSAALRVKPAVFTFNPLSPSDATKTVEEGAAIVLYCEVSHPFAPVSWSKDGEELSVRDGLNLQADGLMRRLVLLQAGPEHAGEYSCQTQHHAVSFRVEVTGPPVVFRSVPEEEQHKSSLELDPVVLLCHVSREDAAVTWSKDGCELQAGENVTLQAEGTMRRLIIRSALASDAGVYVCRAGDNSQEFTVSVREPPVMIVEPKDDMVVDAYVSEDVLLQCELSRSAGRVRWSKDGQDVEEEGPQQDLEQEGPRVKLTAEGPYRSLSIHNCTVEDSGEYVCETDGDSLFFQLNVTEPPVRFIFPTEPELELTHTASERLELRCEVSQAEAPVLWFKDGLEVEEGPNLQLEVEQATRRLVIPVPTPQDNGEYVCDTEDDSVAFLLTVTEPAVSLRRPQHLQENLKCLADVPLVLESEVSRTSARVTWCLDGEPIEPNPNVSISEDGLTRRLTVHCPSTSDSGTYTCGAGDDHIHFHVQVTEPPVSIVRKQEVNTAVAATVGDDVVLECEVSRPDAVTKWFRDGERVESGERVCVEEEGPFRSLVLLCAEVQDSAEYFLDAGDDGISFQVTVREPPVRIVGNSSDVDYQEMVAGDELILACEVSRVDAPVRWFWNDRPLLPDSRVVIQSSGTLHKLIISDIQTSHSGQYVCDALDDRMVSVVRVQESPVTFINKQEDLVLVGFEAESLDLTCYVSRESAAVRWLKDWTPVEGERFRSVMEGHKRTLTLQPLRRSDAGEYTCDAHTDQCHFSLLVKEMRVKFTEPLQDTVARADGMVTLRCQVGKAKADVQWLRGGQEITPSRRYTIRAEGQERSLTIHRLTRDDAGEYACESKDDRTAALLVVEMPRVVEFLTELHNTTVLEGEDATFKCVVSPEDVSLRWLMDSVAVAVAVDGRITVLHNGLCHTLVIHKCTMTDCARITAEAEGQVSKASLRVQEAQITFTKRMESVMAEEMEDATLQTEVSLDSGEVQWMRQGVVIQAGPHYSLTHEGRTRRLTLHNLTLNDRGTYRCESLHDRTQVKLHVEPRKISVRSALLDQEAFEREAASFQLELSHTDVEGSWQKDGIRVKPSAQVRVSRNGRVHSLTLSGLTLEDTGTIVFTADGLRTSARLTVKGLRSNHGNSARDFHIFVLQQKQTPRGSLLHVICISVSTSPLRVLKSKKVLRLKRIQRNSGSNGRRSNLLSVGPVTSLLSSHKDVSTERKHRERRRARRRRETLSTPLTMRTKKRHIFIILSLCLQAQMKGTIINESKSELLKT
uniref:Obscurin-like protein 1 n=1 Tax=Knipowitschia caucasica TaxID=637954 RepID=A0AAV2LE12_KNICA